MIKIRRPAPCKATTAERFPVLARFDDCQGGNLPRVNLRSITDDVPTRRYYHH
jgi:hypothetical protein